MQEFLRGIEYVVDSASSGGEHRVAAIWRCKFPFTTPNNDCDVALCEVGSPSIHHRSKNTAEPSTNRIESDDRRAINGAGFVLLGQRLLAPEEPEVALLTTYAFSVLNALEFQHGPSHMEVKLCPKPGR